MAGVHLVPTFTVCGLQQTLDQFEVKMMSFPRLLLLDDVRNEAAVCQMGETALDIIEFCLQG